MRISYELKIIFTDSEVIFSKEIDEAPQLARLPTPVPTSAASKESFSQELADLDWNAAAEPVKSDLVPEQEVAVKSEPKSEQKVAMQTNPVIMLTMAN